MPTTLRVELEQDGPSTTRAAVRSHTLYIDRPTAKGGADRGPLGGEYQLVALGGCFSSHLLAAIRAREAPISQVRVTVSGTMDGAPERFTSFSLAVEAVCDDRDLLEKLVSMAERACQVTNTLRQSTPIEVTATARAPSVV
ncbi:MAG TPA: OsmC family protein [Vicinamibacterales bacterium]